MTTPLRPTVIAALLAFLASTAALSAEPARGSYGDDRVLAGDDVLIDGRVEGDTFVAAGRSRVDGVVEGDAIVAGGTVELRGEILGNVYAAGGDVRVDASVGGRVRAAGGTVSLEPGSRIGEGATLAGGSIEVYGRVDGDLEAYGGRVRIDGEVQGDVEVASEDIRIGPDALIAGQLLYQGPNRPLVADGAVIAGGIERKRQGWSEFGPESGVARVVAGVFRTLWFAGVLLLGIAMVALFPAFTREAAATLRSDALASAGLGLALLVALPILAVVLFITIIGIPLGFTVLFGYGMLLMLGYLTGALAVGDLALSRLKPAEASATGWRIIFLAVALAALALLRHVPWIGALAVFLLFLAGLGAFTLRSMRGYRA